MGDYDPNVTAHQAIPAALTRAASDAGEKVTWTWLDTTRLNTDVAPLLAGFSGIWCVPASPYANTAGAIRAIRFARETRLPFLGTCGGFQHALLEYAEAVWGIAKPAHAELDSSASDPVISPLECSLVETTGELKLVPGSRLERIYGVASATETYHCRYGLNPFYIKRLETGPLRVSARDDAGEIRAVELEGHPFFMATLFQPERVALKGESHPLIAAFVMGLLP